MKKPMVRIYTDNDIFVDREMTDEEFAQHEIDKAQSLEATRLETEKIAAREALLAKLGITAEEAQLLIR
jgi:hypothetical protein